MSITVAGIISIIVAIIFSIVNTNILWLLVFMSSTFTATCALDLYHSQNAIPIFYVIGGIFILKILYMLIRKKYKFKRDIIKNSLFIFVLICTISIFYPLAFSSGVVVTKPSGIREELFFSAQHITQLMYLLFAYFVYIASRVYLHNEKIDLKYVTKVFRITMIVVLVMGILQYLLPSDIFDNLLRNNYGTIYGKYRITSVNNEASFLALFITPMIGYFVFNYIKYRELIDLTIVLFTLVTIKFHSSSSFILGCIIIVLAVVFYFRKELVDNIKKCKSVKLKNKILVIILAILGAGFILFIFKNPAIIFIQKIFGQGESGGIRKLMFEQSIQVFKSFFITGVGFGSMRSGDLFSSWLAQIGLIGMSVYLVYISSRVYRLYIKGFNENTLKYALLILITNIIMFISVPEPFFGYIWVWYAVVDYILDDNLNLKIS